MHNKSLRQIFEAAAILFFKSLNTCPGFYDISPYLSKSILNSYNIFHLSLIFSTNGPGDLGSIPGRVIPKTQKMVLDASLLNTQHYKVRIKGKVEQSREGVAPSPTPWCSSYRKGSLRVTLDYGRQLYFFTLWFLCFLFFFLFFFLFLPFDLKSCCLIIFK